MRGDGSGAPDAQTWAETDYAELADRVYDRIERRLHRELLADLERRGTLMDWR